MKSRPLWPRQNRWKKISDDLTNKKNPIRRANQAIEKQKEAPPQEQGLAIAEDQALRWTNQKQDHYAAEKTEAQATIEEII